MLMPGKKGNAAYSGTESMLVILGPGRLFSAALGRRGPSPYTYG